MITPFVLHLLLLLGVLAVGFWISVMVLWWHEVQENEHATLDRLAMKNAERVIRLSRRTYYAGTLYSKRAFAFGNKHLTRAFIRVFPQAAPAFQKHDMMAGLEHGPSSYFLHSISSTKEDGAKPKARRKKIVA